jgi:SNF2 family DNA or RNA helicase
MRAITADDRNFIISFDYELELVTLVKELPMRDFKKSTKTWTVPLAFRKQVEEFAKEYGFKLSLEAISKMNLPASVDDEIRLPDMDTPLPNGNVPFEHQKRGVAFLAGRRRAILADDMGLGKTLQALFAAKAFGIKTIVIAPASLQDNWKREAENVGIEIDVYTWGKMPQMLSEDFVLIADEAHYAQAGNRSQRGKRFLEITQDEHCKAVFCLTGTPLKNGRPINFLPLLQAVRHPLSMNVTGYQRRYCDGKVTRFSRWDVSGATNLKELHELTKDVMLRRKKEECLDLPGKIRVYRAIEWTEQDKKIYDTKFAELQRAWQERVGKGIISDESEALVAVGHLRQAASAAKISTAIEITEELREQHQFVVILPAYKETARYLNNCFEGGAYLLTGDTPVPKRQALVDGFQRGDRNVFVATIGVGGLGITLTKAQTVIMLDRPWTPGDTEQAEDRLYRIGQKNMVTSIWLQANEIDKTVDAILEAKAEVIELVLNGKRKRIARTSTEKQITKTIAEMIF